MTDHTRTAIPESPDDAVIERLLPAESMALTVALAQVLRGEVPDPNVATVCVLAMARCTGRHDWTEDDDA